MKNRIMTGFAAFLLAAALCFQTALPARAAAIRPDDIATKENVLEALHRYDPDAYYLLKAQADGGWGIDFMTWFESSNYALLFGDQSREIFTGMDTCVHETCHMYCHNQYPGYYGYSYYLGDGKSHDVDGSIAFQSDFTKTEEMAKLIPAELQTLRYNQYVGPGAGFSSNTRGVFGLLDEFLAYQWGLEVMNSLTQFLVDADASRSIWNAYVISIGNNSTAYAEFKYWTLRYMLYIKTANPSLYQAILDNREYCAAYRDTEEKFASELERARKILSDLQEYLEEKDIYILWGISYFGEPMVALDLIVYLDDCVKLTAELEKAEYVEMDAIIKAAASAPAKTPETSDTPAFQAALSPQKLTVNGAEIDCEKYNIDGSNYFKLRDIAYLLSDSPARFSVSWDAAGATVGVVAGEAYVPDGSELATDGTDKSASAVPSSQTIRINGETVTGLSVYNIGGNNYFRLRDLGEALGFRVDYIPETNTAAIEY